MLSASELHLLISKSQSKNQRQWNADDAPARRSASARRHKDHEGKETSSMIHIKTVLVNGIISTIDRFLCATQLFAEDVSPLALCPVERLVGLLENLGRD